MPITFFLQSTKKPAPIYVRIREGISIDAKARTKFTVYPDEWSKAKGLSKERDAAGKMLNSELLEFKKNLNTRLNHRTPFEVINSEWLKAYINPPQQAEPLPNNLILYFDKYIEAKQAEVLQEKLTQSTVKKCKVNRNLLSRMQDDLKTQLLIEDVSLSFVQKFKEYCINHGYAPNTIARAVTYITTICRDARKKGLKTHSDLDSIIEKPVKSKHIYLTFDELEMIERVELSEHLDNSRDWLLISCYTGQRVSDFMRFSKDFIRTENKKQLIEFTQVKTGKIMTVPIHKKVKAILEKRNGEFPRAISDQRYNDYIKEVCKIAGLTYKVEGSRKNPKTNRKETGIFQKWELVSSHIGRRSFATNHYGEIPTSLLSFATGHTTEKQFLNYIGKTDSTKALQLADYF